MAFHRIQFQKFPEGNGPGSPRLEVLPLALMLHWPLKNGGGGGGGGRKKLMQSMEQ